MILAVMTRVARSHFGRDLSADRNTSLIYILVTLAAIARIAAAFAIDWMMSFLAVSDVFGFPLSVFSRRAAGRCCSCRAKPISG